METAFYEESSLLSSHSKSVKSYDGHPLWLNLYADGTKRDDFAFSDLGDFLRSPDLGISSPDLENLVWKEWSDVNKSMTPMNLVPTIDQEQKDDENITNNITKEQEVFAFGFTEALKKLKEEDHLEIRESDNQTGPDNDGEASDSSSDDESTVLLDEENDTKITFISYAFNSKQPLPSFQETFSKITFVNIGNEVSAALQIKRENDNFEVPMRPLEFSQRDVHSAGTIDKVENTETPFYWDRVETLDEGFCVSKETTSPVLTIHSGHEIFTEENHIKATTKSSTQDLSDIIPKEYGGDYVEDINEKSTQQRLILGLQRNSSDASPQDSMSASSATDDALFHRFKVCRKKQNHRFNAVKIEKSAILKNCDSSTEFNDLNLENAKLIAELEIIRKSKECLALPFLDATRGYPETHT
ncbi:predicted protein [Nematostella vectensis]|uniref:Uncharacterized protein n=1 Tax=Nematostella vectensis TaxID=45351 RepID=A7RZI0_NEMVE|nr:predicted protein [Nematostella vectensis]|eukprot:XP_001635159.1 predicted protein [Nematostella vectensis]